jgi:myotubularin-related protein 10/11/12
LQEFAISKNIQLGDEKGLKFPSVWDWSLQFTAKDRTLFHNPFYIGKSTACVQNGSGKSFKRTKVNYSSALTTEPPVGSHNQTYLQNTALEAGSLPTITQLIQVFREHSLSKVT